MEILRALQGGLNLDDSEELMSPDDWSHAENIVVGPALGGKNFEKQNVRGTTPVNTGPIDLTGCVFIGEVKDNRDDVSYLFYAHQSDATKNCIVKLANGVMSLVIRWEGLKFSTGKSGRINGGAVIGDYLYYVHGTSPKCVSLSKYVGGAVPANEEEILFHKRGPNFAPQVNDAGLTAGSTVPIEDVQFAMQYEYEDGQHSVISPWTKMYRGRGMDGVAGGLSSVPMRIHDQESIPTLVVRVKMVARKGNDGVPFYWMVIDRDDFDQVNYNYVYDAQASYGGVVPTGYLKPFDLVPRTARSFCVSKGRAFFGNIVEGYDTPDNYKKFGGATFGAPINLSASFIDAGNSDDGISFSPNSRYRLGIVLHDDQNRSSGVYSKDSWVVDTTATIVRNGKKYLQFEFTDGTSGGGPHLPSFIKHYSLVMTKDLAKTYFIQGESNANVTDGAPYTDINEDGQKASVMTFSGQAYFRINMKKTNAGGVFYTFKDGDYVTITSYDTNGDPVVTSPPLRVRFVEGLYLYVDGYDMGNSGADFDYAFQIFSPNRVNEEIYYEVARFAAGTYNDVLGNPRPTVQTGVQTLKGDTIFKVLGGSVTNKYTQMQYDPDGDVRQYDYGKPFVKTPQGEVSKPTAIRWSSPFIAGTRVNGLNEFNAGDEEIVPIESVSIQKLQPTSHEESDGDLILAICNSNTYSVYLDESRVRANDGQSLVISTVDVIGDVRRHGAGFGTLHPESVMLYKRNVYWWDMLSRSYVRYATNGIFPISRYKAVRYFERQAVLNSSSSIVVSGYDPFYNMVFVTFASADSDVKKTICFSEDDNRWKSFFNFAPSGYVTGSRVMYTAKDDALYSHSDESNFNRFYGVTYSSKLRVSFNDSPDRPKEWKAIQVQASPNFFEYSGGMQRIVADALRVDVSNQNGQATSILHGEFDPAEYIAYGEIRGDENSGTVLSGDSLYSNTLQCDLTFSGGSHKRVTLLKAGCEVSRGHNL